MEESTGNDGPTIPAGTVVGERYRIVRPLGHGGMGTVYLAEHLLIERLVAVKILAAELACDEQQVARFLQEARAAVRGKHENIIKIFDFGETEDSVFLAMEYLEGQNLAELVELEGPLPVPRALRIMDQLCRALHAAHEAGVVHQDIKPENVFLVHREGRDDFVKLLDFGLAKLAPNPDTPFPLDLAAPHRVSSHLCGTPQYMSPEQAAGEVTDRRSDIYALGCVLYELLTGEPPLCADTALGQVTRKLLDEPEPPGRRAPRPIPATVEDACLRALARDRNRRFPTALALAEALGVSRAPRRAAAAPERPLGHAHHDPDARPTLLELPSGAPLHDAVTALQPACSAPRGEATVRLPQAAPRLSLLPPLLLPPLLLPPGQQLPWPLMPFPALPRPVARGGARRAARPESRLRTVGFFLGGALLAALVLLLGGDPFGAAAAPARERAPADQVAQAPAAPRRREAPPRPVVTANLPHSTAAPPLVRATASRAAPGRRAAFAAPRAPRAVRTLHTLGLKDPFALQR